MIVERPIDHLTGRCLDSVSDVAWNVSITASDECCRTLDRPQRPDESATEPQVRDWKIVYSTLGRGAVESIARNLHFAHRIFLNPKIHASLHVVRRSHSNGVDGHSSRARSPITAADRIPSCWSDMPPTHWDPQAKESSHHETLDRSRAYSHRYVDHRRGMHILVRTADQPHLIDPYIERFGNNHCVPIYRGISRDA